MGRLAIDLTGEVFGKLKMLKPIRNSDKGVIWKCVCSCGGPNRFMQILGSTARLRGRLGCIDCKEKHMRKVGKAMAKKSRNPNTDKIRKLRKKGWTIRALGAKFDLSPERIRQLTEDIKIRGSHEKSTIAS